jgi:hypothetical protein
MDMLCTVALLSTHFNIHDQQKAYEYAMQTSIPQSLATFCCSIVQNNAPGMTDTCPK